MKRSREDQSESDAAADTRNENVMPEMTGVTG